ncbi:MAG: hypothetical protein ABIP03_07845 [Aquihabitans sp.]
MSSSVQRCSDNHRRRSGSLFSCRCNAGPEFQVASDGADRPLGQHINKYRWIEYSMSSSIMIIVILQLNGTADFVALLGIVGVNASMILFDWLQERYATPGDGDMLPFWLVHFSGPPSRALRRLWRTGPPQSGARLGARRGSVQRSS